jgi:hypothetical protein
MMRSVLSGLLFGLAVSGCSDSLTPGTIDGTWVSPFSVPGNSWTMDLTAAGSTVTGTGSACGEAAACATLTVQGTINGAKVHLDFVASDFRPPPGPGSPTTTTSHFDGALIGSTSLVGTLAGDSPSFPAVAVRYQRGLSAVRS